MKKMKNNASFISKVLQDNNLSVLEQTLVLYLLTCKTKKDDINGIAEDFFMLPTKLFGELQRLEHLGYLKIKVEVNNDLEE